MLLSAQLLALVCGGFLLTFLSNLLKTVVSIASSELRDVISAIPHRCVLEPIPFIVYKDYLPDVENSFVIIFDGNNVFAPIDERHDILFFLK